LEQLVEDGFLVVVKIAMAKDPCSAYQPTEKGKEMFRKLGVQGTA
jgi:DNA-binding HxlR family transcriptional regulator